MSSLLFGLPPLVIAVHAIVLLTVIPVHEFAHGYAAYKLGDETAHLQGRLTLNPMVHMDLFGTIAMLVVGIGWAKPVPVNPRNFKNPRGGLAISSLAGPLANIILALITLILYKLIWATGFFYVGRASSFPLAVKTVFEAIIAISLRLAVFNLFPVPPLDGFKIFGSLLPKSLYDFITNYETYIFIALMVLLLSTDIVYAPILYGSQFLLNVLEFITSPLDLL